MSLILPICVLFISLMQSVNETQFLNTFSIPLLTSPPVNAANVIVPITSTNASL